MKEEVFKGVGGKKEQRTLEERRNMKRGLITCRSLESENEVEVWERNWQKLGEFRKGILESKIYLNLVYDFEGWVS